MIINQSNFTTNPSYSNLDLGSQSEWKLTGSYLTKTQVKVMVIVIVLIGGLLLIIVLVRFKTTCRSNQEISHFQSESVRRRKLPSAEPSSRRGSIGYYTRKYTRPVGFRSDEPNNSLLQTKRFSYPSCDHSSVKSKTTIFPSSSSRPTTTTRNSTVLPQSDDFSCQKSSLNCIELSQQQQQQPAKVSVKPLIPKSRSLVGISRCGDQTPLLTSELPSTTNEDSSNHHQTTRQYSLNAFLPIARTCNAHPPPSHTSSLLKRTTTVDGNHVNDCDQTRSTTTTTHLKPLRRSSLVKSAQITLISKKQNNRSSLQYLPTSSSSQDHATSQPLKSKVLFHSKGPLRKKSSSITPITSPYRKDFMQKIERFRFIDDSASSTTTVTSPVESIDRMNNGHQTCSHLITSAIEQFDDYVRSRYQNHEEINTYIDRLNVDVLTNGSYSDLNILNNSNEPIDLEHSQTRFQPVTNPSRLDDYRQTVRTSASITIPSSSERPSTIVTNGHSRSMDFPITKTELIRPVALKTISTIYETCSSSLATLTSTRSTSSLEFDDDTKPSGVLVDDDFLPMSSPVDDHFWDMNHFQQYTMKSAETTPSNERFPNVGSSPDIEKKQFHFQPVALLPSSSSIDPHLSETSCDEDEEDFLANQQKYSIHQYQMKELQKPTVIQRLTPNDEFILTPMQRLTLNSDESLLEKFAASTAATETSPPSIHSPRLRSLINTDIVLTTETIYEEDDTQESSTTNENGSDESADNGEIDLLHEFELSQKHDEDEREMRKPNWNSNNRDIFIVEDDDHLSSIVNALNHRPLPPSIMKMPNQKSFDSLDDPIPSNSSATTPVKPKVRFNLDPQYEREREWNKVNKLLGNSVEWTDEFEV